MSKVTTEDIQEATERAPEVIKKFEEQLRNGNAVPAGDVFTGDLAQYEEVLRAKGIARLPNETRLAAEFNADGDVVAMAAAVSRTPTKAETYLQDVPDLKATGGLTRAQKMALYQQIFRNEGAINNAIKKKAALVSQEGSFVVRAAKKGRGKSAGSAADDLLTLLNYWAEHVNSAAEESVITGSRGVRQVIRRGSRQAMIEGDLFLREMWSNISVPPLAGKSFKLPMFMQALPAAEVVISEDFESMGVELYYWEPSSDKVRALTSPTDPNVKKLINRVVSSDILSQLKKDRRALLDPALLMHIKHAGTDPEPYGHSDVEPALTDLAYSRALKSLDFVTIDSLINRMLVIKIGDENPDSAYHNLAVAQKRVNVFANLVRDVGPNMMVLWAGHDISTTDIGAHDAVLDTDNRQARAGSNVKLATGVPDPLLTGSAEGGNAVAWAGFVALGAVAAELQEEFAQALSQLGQRIAEQNNFKDVNLVWQFSHNLLADTEANSKIFIQAYDRGLVSRQTMIEELGKEYAVEKARKMEEEPDEELFAAPILQPGGPGGNQGTEPGKQPGKPSSKGNPKKTGPERDRERKDIKA
ncbi:MAG: hypothetical protein KOO63_12440 [Bacteroidales bacterium]|nr:hypothetical protein [Candidatus Latescibacterota bacterium]